MGLGDRYIQNFTFRDFLQFSPRIFEEPETTGATPLELPRDFETVPARVFALEDDGTITITNGVPVEIPLDADGMATLQPGQRAVALWIDKHQIPQERLFFDRTGGDVDAVCPMLNDGPIHRNGDTDQTLLARSPAEHGFGFRPIFRNYGNTAACGTYVLADGNDFFSCTEPGSRCYIDRMWREMLSLSIRLNNPTRVTSQTATSESSPAASWNSANHSLSVPTVLRSISND